MLRMWPQASRNPEVNCKSFEMNDTTKNHNGHLTSGRLLARNTIWNLIGGGAPMLVWE